MTFFFFLPRMYSASDRETIQSKFVVPLVSSFILTSIVIADNLTQLYPADARILLLIDLGRNDMEKHGNLQSARPSLSSR